ncbi:TIGR02808 family protein [Endozoicomonas sp. (ex Bugula neritina AB1)]|nr:TIGR02808 family protein [Endozoicomonas sp. (ex Bugula neritina AB1)]
MSSLESFIWHLLGYAAMPAIFIGGFLVTALIFCFLMDKISNR